MSYKCLSFDMDECDVCHCWDLCIILDADAFCSYECIKKLEAIRIEPFIAAYTHPEST